MKNQGEMRMVREIHSDKGVDGLSAMLWVTLILLMAGVVLVVSGGGRAQSTTETSVPYQSGQVTGKHGESIQINQRDYALDTAVEVKDDEGRLRELKDVKEGAEIRFHLKNERIDKLVLVLPK